MNTVEVMGQKRKTGMKTDHTLFVPYSPDRLQFHFVHLDVKSSPFLVLEEVFEVFQSFHQPLPVRGRHFPVGFLKQRVKLPFGGLPQRQVPQLFGQAADLFGIGTEIGPS